VPAPARIQGGPGRRRLRHPSQSRKSTAHALDWGVPPDAIWGRGALACCWTAKPPMPSRLQRDPTTCSPKWFLVAKTKRASEIPATRQHVFPTGPAQTLVYTLRGCPSRPTCCDRRAPFVHVTFPPLPKRKHTDNKSTWGNLDPCRGAFVVWKMRQSLFKSRHAWQGRVFQNKRPNQPVGFPESKQCRFFPSGLLVFPLGKLVVVTISWRPSEVGPSFPRARRT
jgi:hypothetical protein